MCTTLRRRGRAGVAPYLQPIYLDVLVNATGRLLWPYSRLTMVTYSNPDRATAAGWSSSRSTCAALLAVAFAGVPVDPRRRRRPSTRWPRRRPRARRPRRRLRRRHRPRARRRAHRRAEPCATICVAPAAPTAFTLTGRKFTIKAHVCAHGRRAPARPARRAAPHGLLGEDGFGVAPGSHAATTYVLGHAWAPDPQEVLNRLSAAPPAKCCTRSRTSRRRADLPGARAGRYEADPAHPGRRLTYTVQQGVRRAQAGLGSVKSAMNQSYPTGSC